MGKGKGKKPKQKNQLSKASLNKAGVILVDPERMRFQHSKIRPYFSGCGRSVKSTLDSIRNGDLNPADLPLIQVIAGPDENDGKGPWYFSLNNRRLWVLKRCREEGLLHNNLVQVRVREVRSTGEINRYTVANCAVEANFIREKEKKTETILPEEVGFEQDIVKSMQDLCTDDDSKKNRHFSNYDNHPHFKVGDHDSCKSDDDGSEYAEKLHHTDDTYKNHFCFHESDSSDDEC
mmetsp:Transcript_4538/g.5899  ORF Transcript_4538/g.5899 Transcript_4538/m.5899 type:complete len:234 (+) Transcript_4538:240-941(+)